MPQKFQAPILEDSRLKRDEVAEKRRVAKGSIQLLSDVTVEVCVELGRAKMKLRDILKLSKGMVIELEKMAGEVLDIKIGDEVIAHGEVVIVGEKLGIRIKEIEKE